MNPDALRFFGVVLRTFPPARFMPNHDLCWLRKLTLQKRPRIARRHSGTAADMRSRIDGPARFSSTPLRRLVEATRHRNPIGGSSPCARRFRNLLSRLSSLRLFPFEQIKINRWSVGKLSSNPDCAAIVSAVARLRGLRFDTATSSPHAAFDASSEQRGGLTPAKGS
jgi:hypothetical protein